MSRHRDVRCMNYSDEYDGYDDVYGHSVEDDYCVSPSAEQFLFDRSKQQNIASFITEPDIVEDNEDIEDSVSSHNDKKLDFSEIETAKLISCIESIRNVIGDLVPESKLKEEIIKADFDTEAVLDAILKKSSPTSISKQSVDNKDYLDCCPDGSTDMINNTNCPIPSFPLQRKFRFITDNTTTETVTNTPGTCLSNSFSSLTEMIAHHTKSVSSSVKKPIENDKKIQSFGSLADLTAHHLQNANGTTESEEFHKRPSSLNTGFVIPKLLIKKDSNNIVQSSSTSAFLLGSHLQSNMQNIQLNIPKTKDKDLFDKNLSDICLSVDNATKLDEDKLQINLQNITENYDRVRSSSPDWLIDLSAALKEVEDLDVKNLNSAKPVQNLHDTDPSDTCVINNDGAISSILQTDIDCILNISNLRQMKVLHIKKTVSSLGKILSRRWKLKKPFIEYQSQQYTHIKRFDFSTPYTRS